MPDRLPDRPDRPDRLTEAQRHAVAELLRVSPVVDELGTRFQSRGHQIALVGGSVRDALIGRLEYDLDFATSARPEQTREVLDGWADAVWEIGIDFGTVGARKNGFQLEITTYRSDAYHRASRKPEVRYGDTLEEDLGRRDFTVNAMAVTLPVAPSGTTFVDPFGGLRDLADRVLRTPAGARTSFDDDPLRMLRAARFAAQLGFEVAPDVVDAMHDMAGRIQIVSAERVRDELVRLVEAARPRAGLELLVNTGLAAHVLPELPRLRLEIDEHHRHKDVYEHSLTVLEQAITLEDPERSPDFVLRFAALMHDVGKPRTRRLEPDGRVSFHHHEIVGRDLTRARMKALRFDKQTTEDVCRLVELHLRFHGYGTGEWTDAAVRRYVRDAGPLLDRLHKLTRSDCTTRNRRKAAALSAAYDSLERRIRYLAEQEELARIRPALDGNQIMKILGLEPGPLVGEARQYLLDLRLERGPMSAEESEAELRAWWDRRTSMG